MNREEYIKKLETLLKRHLTKNELCEILADYNEYFQDGYRQNKNDTEIIAKLGSPEIIAKQFIDELASGKEPIISDAAIEDLKDR